MRWNRDAVLLARVSLHPEAFLGVRAERERRYENVACLDNVLTHGKQKKKEKLQKGASSEKQKRKRTTYYVVI